MGHWLAGFSGLLVGLATRSKLYTSMILGAAIGSAAWLVIRIFQGLFIQKLLGTILFIAYSPSSDSAWPSSSRPPSRGLATSCRRPGQAFLPLDASGLVELLLLRPRHQRRAEDHGRHYGRADLRPAQSIPEAGRAFPVPYEIIVACGIAIALGTLIGGHKIVRTMGTRLTHLDTTQGFAAETSSALGLYYPAQFGVPRFDDAFNHRINPGRWRLPTHLGGVVGCCAPHRDGVDHHHPGGGRPWAHVLATRCCRACYAAYRISRGAARPPALHRPRRLPVQLVPPPVRRSGSAAKVEPVHVDRRGPWNERHLKADWGTNHVQCIDAVN